MIFNVKNFFLIIYFSDITGDLVVYDPKLISGLWTCWSGKLAPALLQLAGTLHSDAGAVGVHTKHFTKLDT